jgi:uncharacterized protein (DUF433 family)
VEEVCPNRQQRALYFRFFTGVKAVDDQQLLQRITVNPEIFSGKPIIRGMRISVEMILSLLKQGETFDAILEDYPDLEPEDIRACLAYAIHSTPYK